MQLLSQRDSTCNYLSRSVPEKRLSLSLSLSFSHSFPFYTPHSPHSLAFSTVFDCVVTDAEYAMACSHDRSIHLFLQSIPSTRGCTFTAYPCASEDDFRAGRCLSCGNRPCPTMGYRAEVYKREGTFYLDTFARPSFCGECVCGGGGGGDRATWGGRCTILDTTD